MSKMITQNQTLNFFSEIKKYIGACCFLVMLIMMSGTAWAQIPGAVCEGPINISGLPYVTTDNTSAYGNDYTSSDRPPIAPGAIGSPSASYLGGDDVVYAYTPSSNENLTVTVSDHDSWVGLFIFTGCPFSSTVGGQVTSSATTTLSVANLPATAGVTYYFVISTWPTPNNTPYTLNIQSVAFDCPLLEANFGSACDDGNSGTYGDTIDANCDCAGIPYDCLEVEANIGDACAMAGGMTGELDENCECVEVQCQNTSKYPSNAIIPSATGESTQISSCSYWSEYSEIGGIVSGFEYEFNSVKEGVNAFVTVRSGSVGGAIVASGFGPLTITALSSDNLFVHWNLDAICTTQSGCAVSTVACISCATAPDCEGVIGGPAQPGTACDDGNPETYNDVYQDDCSCAGVLPVAGSFCESAIAIECNGDAQTFSSTGSVGANTTACFMGAKGLWFSFVGTGAEIIINSTASFDHRLSVNSGSCDTLTSIVCKDASTGAENYTIASSVAGETYFVYIAHYSSASSTTGDITISLVCAEAFDCPQFGANIGDACDDGDDMTENDVLDANCGCAGTPVQQFDCPQLEANIGDDCDDQNADTENDVIDANCGCAGTPIIVFDCPQLEANIGDDCDDQNADTENDVIDANCGCAGTPIIVFDCPQLEANIGDDCDDQNADTENDVIDANCGCAGTPVQEFDCPDLEANFGDACNDGDPNTGNDVLIGDCSCAGTPIVTPTCEDFVYYISDHAAADGISDIYSVTLSGGVATMEYIATSDIEIHIAYNEVDNLIYAVSKHTNSYRTLNPHVVAPSFGPTIALGADYGELTAAAFNADGKLVIGSQNNNAIYSVNVTSNLVSPYDAYSPVTGGDLAFGIDGMLYLATRSGNGLYENYPSPAGDVLIGSVTSKVTGLAITASNQLLVSNQGNSSLEVRNLDGTNPGTTYVLTLDGEPFTLRDGDMASGCNSFDDTGEEECGNYKLYYIHSPQGAGQQPLLEVTLNGDGTASYSTVIANIGGHIGISPDGSIIYNVNTNKLKVIDVNAASVIATINIVTSGGASLSGFPAATVAADGTLYVGHSGTNQVYSLDPITGVATPYGPSRNVNGGDLIDVNGEIWLITRNNNKFTNVITGVSFTVPVTEINGAAVLGNGNVLLADGNGGSLLKEVELATQTVVATYDISLPLFNGDLAGVCAPGGGLTTECYGFEILDFVQGLQTNGSAVPANRSDATAALGEPDRSNAAGGFVSLGVGGYITIGFGGVIYDAPGNDIRIWETSFSGDVCGASDDENADIAVSQDGVNFVSVGSICRDGEVDIAGTGLDYVSAIRITNSASTASLDGYDVDGVEAINGCSDEPIIEEGDCYATEVVEYIQGTSSNGGAIATNRTDASKALGAPERVDQLVFVSLGYGGSITLAFDGAIPNGPGDDIEVVETTYGNSSCATYAEFADVYVSVDGTNFFFAKTVCRADGFVDISDAGSFAYVNFVKIVNNNDLSTTPDAFDVDGVVALYNCEDDLVTPGFRPVTESELSSFPNPTAGQSQVVFVTAETGSTLVEVYDMNGRNIATLFNAEAQNGKEYRLDFDGAALPNGVYIYRMTTNNESIIEKFMIAK